MGLTPSPTDRAPCGSKSTSSTLRPTSASAAPRLIVVVVLPTPPFWLHMAMMRAGPCDVSGAGSGNVGSGRPVGPSPGTSGTAGSGSALVDAVGGWTVTGGLLQDGAGGCRLG